MKEGPGARPTPWGLFL